MSKDDLSDWGDPEREEKKKNGNGKHSFMTVWKPTVSISGLILIFHQAMFTVNVNVAIVLAALIMMGFPVARWLDKLQ